MELASGNEKEIDWSALPGLVLSLVADKLDHVTEFVRFGVVCTSWNAIYKDIRHSVLRDILQEPLLLLLPDVDDKKGQLRTLYSLNQKKVYKNFRLSVPHNEFCVGSTQGWLAMVSYDYQLRLLNPFLPVNNEIKLPPFPEEKGDPADNGVHLPFDSSYVEKVVLSGDPVSNPNYVVMAIHSGCRQISFYKKGDKEWSSLRSKELRSVTDVIYSDDKFYVFSSAKEAIFTFDLNGSSPVMSIETPELEEDEALAANYLVKSGSDILCVARNRAFELQQGVTMDDLQIESDEFVWDFDDCHDIDRYYTETMDVYKFDQNKRVWNVVESLDGRILFVGDNSSLALSASDMPGCKPNSIYFNDDNHASYFKKMGARNTGSYSLEDGRAEFFNLEDDGSIQLCNLEDGSIQRLKFKMIGAVPVFIQPSQTRPLT